jgi:predicted dehydrogenase
MAMGTRRRRAAVIGAGFAGGQHVEALRRIGVEVSLIAASEKARAVAAAERLGVESASGDWRRAVEDPSVDVVHVCVPNDLHHDVVLAALNAGKHVVCEKPLALDLGEAAVLAEAAGRSPHVAVVCHNYRFFPMVAELRLRIASGAVGEPHAVRGAYLQDWLLDAETTNWRIDQARGGRSRAIADIGSHWVDLAENVTQRHLEAVMADMATVHGRRPDFAHVGTFSAAVTDGSWVEVSTEDQAGLLLRFEGGLPGTLHLSQVAAGHGNDLELSVDGGTGSATWRQEQPDALSMAHDGALELLARSPQRLSRGADALARLPAGHNEGWADALRNLLAATYAEIDGRRKPAEAAAAPLPTFEDGLRHLAFVEAALTSAAERRWVTIAEVMGAVRTGAARTPATAGAERS